MKPLYLAVWVALLATGYYYATRKGQPWYQSEYSGFSLGFKTGRETPNEISLDVEGNIPSWLEGVLFRNGPGAFTTKTKEGSIYQVQHWFDGLTYLHRFNISQGSVKYMAKSTTEELTNYIYENGFKPMTFGPDPPKSLLDKASLVYSAANGGNRKLANVGVTIKRINHRYFSITDANLLQEFNTESLAVKTPSTYEQWSELLSGPSSCAHGQYDADKKQYCNFVGNYAASTTYVSFCINDDGTVKIGEPFQVPNTYMHSFGMTENYMIFENTPIRMNSLKFLLTQDFSGSLSWDSQAQTEFYVIDRRTGKLVGIYSAEPFFVFHNINGYEEDGNLILDLISYDNMTIISDLMLKSLTSSQDHTLSPSTIKRFTLKNISAAVPSKIQPAEVKVVAKNGELPRINPHNHLKPYNYMYSLKWDPSRPHGAWDGLMKLNVNTGEAIYWQIPHHYPAEPIFVPNPAATSEDDGVVLSIVLDTTAEKSYLVVLDAKDLTLIGKAKIPLHVPYGFHGNFYSDKLLSSDMA